MKKRSVSGILVTAFLMSSPASSATIHLSLNPSDWDRYPVWIGGTNYNASPATIELTAAGNLKGTKTTATGGSNWILGLQSDDSYNFQDAILRYQWLVNGQGTYSAMYSGVYGLIYNVDPYPTSANFLTTAWSFMGSEVIPSNQWLYTEFVFSETGYQFSVSKTGYGNNDFLHGSKVYGLSTWNALGDAHVQFQFGDNYGAGAYFEVHEASIITRGNPVPEPSTMVLLGGGLLGLAVLRRRRKK